MRKLIRAATAMAAAAVASGTLVAGLANTAPSATIPPWEVAQAPATTPAVYPSEVGGLTFYNSSGRVITSGNVSNNPIAAYIQGNTALQPHPTLVDLNGFDPTQSGVPVTAPGNWEEEGLGSRTCRARHRVRLAPRRCRSTRARATACPARMVSCPTPTPRRPMATPASTCWDCRPSSTNDGGTTTTYDTADISVNASTGAWSLVYSPQATTATTLATPTPSSPQIPRHLGDVECHGCRREHTRHRAVGEQRRRCRQPGDGCQRRRAARDHCIATDGNGTH